MRPRQHSLAAAEKQPDSYELAFNLALVQYRLRQRQAALQTLQDYGTKRSLTGEMLNLQGWIYNKMRRSLREAIKAEPDNADHYLDLSTVLRNCRKLTKQRRHGGRHPSHFRGDCTENRRAAAERVQPSG